MKKGTLFIGLLSITAILQAQPKCIIVGPAYSFGSTTSSNYSFTRTYSLVDGAPNYTFSNLGDLKLKSKAVGLMMDIYTKHSRIAFDLMFPLKNTPGNPANFNLAFGGYIKEKVGIFVGASSYGNTKLMNGVPSDPSYSAISFNPDITSQGNFYNDNFLSNAVGLNGLLNIALNETTVIRFDYGIYASSLASKKSPLNENIEWDQTSSRKFELGICLQVPGEPFGFSFKFVNWNTSGKLMGTYDYTFNGNTSSVTTEIIPERSYNLKSFMIALMIPLGNASTTTSTITIL